ncbi:MAG: hypothetical protein FWF10_09545 [Clostridiales bacterium]|nr:hypothetical protein [Clostridiales bacterium]
MNRKKLKKLMRRYPAYFDNSIQLSAAETERIVEAHPCSFEDIIRRAKMKADLPMEAWAAADSVIAQNARLTKQKPPVLLHRKPVIALAVIVVLAIFFALTPVGRTIAKTVIDYIVHFFDDSVFFESDKDSSGIVSDTPEDQLPQPFGDGDFESETQEFQSVEELKSKTGLMPVYLCADYAQPESVTLSVDEVLAEKTTSIVYVFAEGFVGFTQYWIVNASVINAAGKQLESIVVLDNYVMVLYEDEYEHSITGFIVFNDSTLMLTVQAGIDIKEIARFLCNE